MHLLFKGDPCWPATWTLDPDAEDDTWSAWVPDSEAISCDDSSSTFAGDGKATVTGGPGSDSPLWDGEEEAGAAGGEFGWVENTKNCWRPWADGLFLWPSLLAICRALPIAAAAAKCWIIRSSSSASFAPTGNWNVKSYLVWSC